ncbi:MAG: TIM barrel protein [Candidatus Jordarchaeum sp.]|uniref:TIM barrel protein n=1 Tax=Candidatus Jordarchaeum sp. TaxID=2823881 RepID=UPI0040496B1E
MFLGFPAIHFSIFTEIEKVSNIVNKFQKNGLNAFEILFLGNVLYAPKGSSAPLYPSLDQTEIISEKLRGLQVSVHAPYVISLTTASLKRVKNTKAHFSINLKIGDKLRATHITFHCGSMKPRDSEIRVKNLLNEIMKVRENRGYKAMLAPEVAGKIKSFADFDTLIRVAGEIGCLICWDVAHDFARGGMVINEAGLLHRLELIENNIDLGKFRVPIHISGIITTRRGEKAHTTLDDKRSHLPWRFILSFLKEQNFLDKVTIICESKNENDNIEERINETLKIKNFLINNQPMEYRITKSRLDNFLNY